MDFSYNSKDIQILVEKYNKIKTINDNLNKRYGIPLNNIILNDSTIMDKILTKELIDAILIMKKNNDIMLMKIGGVDDKEQYYDIPNCDNYLNTKGYEHDIWNKNRGKWVNKNQWKIFLESHKRYKKNIGLTCVSKIIDPQLGIDIVLENIKNNDDLLKVKENFLYKIEQLKHDGNMLISIQVIFSNIIVDKIKEIKPSEIQYYGKMILGIIKLHPQLLQFIIDELYNKCPLCVPMWPPIIDSNNKENHFKNVLKYDENIKMADVHDNSDRLIENIYNDKQYNYKVSNYLYLLMILFVVQTNDNTQIKNAFSWLNNMCKLCINTNEILLISLLYGALLPIKLTLILYDEKLYDILKKKIISTFEKFKNSKTHPLMELYISGFEDPISYDECIKFIENTTIGYNEFPDNITANAIYNGLFTVNN